MNKFPKKNHPYISSPKFLVTGIIIVCFIFLYNILGFVRLRWWWSSFPSIRPVIRPSKFLIPEEEDDGRGGGGKTPMVLQFAKSYKLIFKN